MNEIEAGNRYKKRQLAADRKKHKTAGSLLSQFHKDSQTQDRMKLLENAVVVVFADIDADTLSKRRNDFNRIKNTKFPIKPQTPCWACNLGDATVRHHIILMKNGGPVTAIKNIVLLCKKCHADIHPWLGVTKETTQSSPATVKAANAFLSILRGIEDGKLTRDSVVSETFKIIDSLFSTR